MRSSMPGFRNVSSLLAVAGVLALAPVFAKDPAEGKSKKTATTVEAHAEAAAIPECLQKLNLSAEQQAEIKEIAQHSDGALGKVWTEFSVSYMQMISLESAMLAAIEDNLTEPQREQVRSHRRKTAHHEKAVAGKGDKLNQATAKPADAVEEGLAGVGVSLNAEQEAAADKIQEKYHPQLHSLHRDIQGFHARLVSLEADKLVRIEKVLTKEQLTQLRAHRLAAPVSSKLAADATAPTKSE